jgi:hypothetical protein
MAADGQYDTHALRSEVALHSYEFPEWEKPSGHDQGFSGGEIIALLVSLYHVLERMTRWGFPGCA